MQFIPGTRIPIPGTQPTIPGTNIPRDSGPVVGKTPEGNVIIRTPSGGTRVSGGGSPSKPQTFVIRTAPTGQLYYDSGGQSVLVSGDSIVQKLQEQSANPQQFRDSVERVRQQYLAQGYAPQEVTLILAGRVPSVAQQISVQDSGFIPPSFFQAEQRRKVLSEAESERLAQEERIESVRRNVSQYEKELKAFEDKFIGRELPQAEYDLAIKEQARLESFRTFIQTESTKAQVMGRVLEDKFQDYSKTLTDIEKKASLEASAQNLRTQQYSQLRQGLGLISLEPRVPKVIAQISAVDPVQTILKEPLKQAKVLQASDLPSKTSFDTRTPLTSEQTELVAPGKALDLGKGLSDVGTAIKQSLEIYEAPLVTSKGPVTMPSKTLSAQEFDPVRLEEKLIFQQPLNREELKRLEPNIEQSRARLSRILVASGTSALYLLPTGVAISGLAKGFVKVGKVIIPKSVKLRWDKLYGTRVVQDIEVLLPTKIRTEIGLKEDLLTAISKGLVKGKTKVVGVGKFNLGKVYSEKAFLLPTKSKSLFKLEDLVQKKVSVTFDKSLQAKALGTKAKVTKMNFDDFGESVATLSNNKIRFSGNEALEQMKNVADTSIFNISTKQRIGSLTSKIQSKLGIGAEKGRVVSNVLAVKDSEVIAQQTRFVLRLQPTQTLGAKRLLPSSLVRSDLLETKTDIGTRIVGKLQQRTVDLIETPKVLKIIKVDVGAKVGIIPKSLKQIAKESGFEGILGVSYKGVGKKSSPEYLKKVMQEPVGKAKLVRESVLSQKERLAIIEKETARTGTSIATPGKDITKQVNSISGQAKPVTNLSNQVVVSGGGLQLMAKSSGKTVTGFTGAQVQRALMLSTQQALKQINVQVSKIASKEVIKTSLNRLNVSLKRVEPLLAVSRVFGVSSPRTSVGVSVPNNVSFSSQAFTITQPSVDTSQIEVQKLRVGVGLFSSSITKPVTPVKMIDVTKLSSPTIQKIVSPTITSVITPTKVGTGVKTVVLTRVGQAVKTVVGVKTALKTTTLTKTVVVPRVTTFVRTPPPIVPIPIIFPTPKFGPVSFSRQRLPRVTEAYKVVTRVGGREKVLRVGVPKNVAINVGSRFVGETPARSFKIVKVGLTRKQDVPIRAPMYKFREPVSLGKVSREGFKFVEKSKYAIESPGEKEGIPGKAQRLRRIGLIGKKGLLRVPNKLV